MYVTIVVGEFETLRLKVLAMVHIRKTSYCIESVTSNVEGRIQFDATNCR